MGILFPRINIKNPISFDYPASVKFPVLCIQEASTGQKGVEVTDVRSRKWGKISLSVWGKKTNKKNKQTKITFVIYG